MTTEKPVSDRVSETIRILKEIRDMGIPSACAEIAELRMRFNEYIVNGTCWSGTIDCMRFGRMMEVELPRRADRAVEVRFRIPRHKL